jgi:hypothetical protein
MLKPNQPAIKVKTVNAGSVIYMTEDDPQRECPLREVFNILRWMVRSGSPR